MFGKYKVHSFCVFGGRRVSVLHSPLQRINNETIFDETKQKCFFFFLFYTKFCPQKICFLTNAEQRPRSLKVIFHSDGNRVVMVELVSRGGDQGQGWKYTSVRDRNTHMDNYPGLNLHFTGGMSLH